MDLFGYITSLLGHILVKATHYVVAVYMSHYYTVTDNVLYYYIAACKLPLASHVNNEEEEV